MEFDKAIALMHKLADEDHTHEEIAAELKKRGFKGPRSGKPLQATQIGYYLRKDPPKASTLAPTGSPIQSPTLLLPAETKIALAIKVLQDAQLNADDRCRIVLAMLTA